MRTIALFTVLLSAISGANASISVVPQSRSAAQLKLRSTTIEAKIEGASGFALVKESWIFGNSATENFEAELVCQAPKNAVMTGFAYYFHGERVVARVVEKTRAANIYNIFNPVNVPMAQRRDPAIAEMLARNLLKVRVGPVEARQNLQVEMFYMQPLEARADKRILPLQLRDGAPVTVQNFSFTAKGVPGVAVSSLGTAPSFRMGDFPLPPTATLEWAAPAPATMLQSDGKSGYFAAILSEAQWKTRPRWKGASEIVSKVLDARRVLVAGKFAGESPAKTLGMKPQTSATSARLWWMALQIESLEKDPNNYKRVVELSNASNLPSAFSSWLAIPSSERRAMEERLNAPKIWELRQEMGKLGNALALWKALGKTNTPQYRAMLADFEKRRAKSGDYYVSQTLEQREKNYVYGLRATLDRYARTSDDLSGAKLASFESQFKRLGAKDYEADLKKAREVLYSRRLNARLLGDAAQGKTVNLKALPVGGREDFLTQLANRSFDARTKNPTRSRQLRALADYAAIKWDMKSVVGNTLYTREYQILGQQIYNVRSAYQSAIIKGTQETPDGQKLARRLRELTARTEFVGHGGLDLSDEIGKAYAQQQVSERAATPDAAKIAQFKSKIERLTRYSGLTVEQVEYAKQRGWSDNSWWSLAELWAREGLTNGYDTPRAEKLETEWFTLHSPSHKEPEGGDIAYFQGAERNVLNELAQATTKQYLDQVTEPAPNDAVIAQLTEQLHALEARSVYNKSYFSTTVLAPGSSFWQRENALTTKIHAEGRKNPPDPARVAALAGQLGQLAADSKNDWIYQRFWVDNAEGKGRGTAQQYGEIRAQRIIVQDQISRTKREFAADKTASLAARAQYDAQIAQLRQRENQLRVRMGDPLIAVKAPADARHVLAITPDGTLLPLEFDALSGEWQARFDVPTYVSAGDFAIQIVVVFADGARQQLKMNLSVDLSAPGGVAAWKREGDGVLISLETDEQTQRVTAFTPWNERVELKRDESGVYSSHVVLPAGFEGGKLRFIVTDKAHNRTEITLDLSDDEPEL